MEKRSSFIEAFKFVIPKLLACDLDIFNSKSLVVNWNFQFCLQLAANYIKKQL